MISCGRLHDEAVPVPGRTGEGCAALHEAVAVGSLRLLCMLVRLLLPVGAHASYGLLLKQLARTIPAVLCLAVWHVKLPLAA